jgi:hypothetical protein
MPNTPKMTIPYPSSTDLVKDGATAMQNLATAVDNKSGLVLLNTTSFSGVASQAINSVFSSTYNNYKIIMNITANTADNNPLLRLRNGVTDKSTNYIYGIYGRQISTAGVVASSSTTTGIYLQDLDAGATVGGFVMDILNPFATAKTIANCQQLVLATDSQYYATNTQTVQTEDYSADGLNLVTTAGAITGTISVYGYNK